VKIYLKVEPYVAAERILKSMSVAQNRNNEDNNLSTIKNIKGSLLRRRKEDSERYFSLYGIWQDDEKNYDLIVDTTDLTIEEVFLRVMNFIESKKNG